MKIECVTSGPLETNGYMVIDEKSSKACIIDTPPGSFDHLIELAKGHEIVGIYLTHAHFDHMAEVAKLVDAWDVPVFIHPLEQSVLASPGSDGIPNYVGAIGFDTDHLLNDGDRFEVGGIAFEVLFTPGHSRGGICFYAPKEKVLFSGDTLFKGGHGNTSFPQADHEQLIESLTRLLSLDDETVVYPGHFGPTTIKDERSMINELSR